MPRNRPKLTKSNRPTDTAGNSNNRTDSTKGTPQLSGLGISYGTGWEQKDENRSFVDRALGLKQRYAASAGLDVKDLFKQRISGNIDLGSRKASADVKLGSPKSKLGGKIKGEIELGDNWLPKSAGIDLGISLLKLGGNISLGTGGRNQSIGIDIGIISGKLVRDKNGEFSFERCVGLAFAESCIITSRHKGDSQPVPGTPRPINPKPVIPKIPRPRSPKVPPVDKRKKPLPKPPKPKPKTPKIVLPKPKPIKLPRPLPVPKPKSTKPVKPKPSPQLPNPKRPTPSPLIPLPPKPKRPNPWPRLPPNPGISLPPGALSPGQIDRAMPRRSCGNLCVIANVYDSEQGQYAQEEVCWGEKLLNISTNAQPKFDGTKLTGWSSSWLSYVDSDYEIPPSLQEWVDGFFDTYSYGFKTGRNYFTIPPETRARCFLESPPPTPKYNPPRLPNPPQQIKPMKDCCDKIEEIYKYLGIAKIKKNKFKVAKAFLAPGGTGNQECEDYYSINEALFRMLANGLIINPVSKPLGSEWKSVNATAWAGNMYEMLAEAMSDGNSTQKFEISMMMQITQLLSIISEQTRKIEFLSEALGIEPDLETEEIPACFTIYEGHKGFEKKEPKKIDISKAKTDDEVEAVLAKMMKPSKIPIMKWVFRPESKSIVQILRDG